ncbi:MAG: VOC family protein [Novosphingobium sp.]
MSAFSVQRFDHIVLAVTDVGAARAFYQRVLGMDPREERPGKWSLHFGAGKISLQSADAMPEIAQGTVAGSGNFCLISETPVAEWRSHLEREGVTILDSGRREGAVGPLDSLYFHDLDRNLVEVSNRL